MATSKQQKLIELVLNHQVQGEAYFKGESSKWKKIALNHFNKIQQEELTISELIQIMSKHGIEYYQREELVEYPIVEFLKFISKISNKPLPF